MQGALVIRDDGARGTIVSESTPGQLVVEFPDGSRAVVSRESIVLQSDGTYRVSSHTEDQQASALASAVIIPVVAKEPAIEKVQVARARRAKVQGRRSVVPLGKEIIDTGGTIKETIRHQDLQVEEIPTVTRPSSNTPGKDSVTHPRRRADHHE